MKNTVETMINHPIATTIVVGCITRGIATIVAAARGKDIYPMVTINKVGKAANDVLEGVKVNG